MTRSIHQQGTATDIDATGAIWTPAAETVPAIAGYPRLLLRLAPGDHLAVTGLLTASLEGCPDTLEVRLVGRDVAAPAGAVPFVIGAPSARGYADADLEQLLPVAFGGERMISPGDLAPGSGLVEVWPEWRTTLGAALRVGYDARGPGMISYDATIAAT